MKNKYNVHHKRQTLANFQKDIHEFHFDYNGEDRIAACVGGFDVIFDDDISEDVELEVTNKILDMMEKYERHWRVPKGAQEIADEYCREMFH